MMVILPHRRDGMATLERGLAKTTLSEAFRAANQPSRAFRVKLPKFKLDQRIDLKRVLHSVRHCVSIHCSLSVGYLTKLILVYFSEL